MPGVAERVMHPYTRANYQAISVAEAEAQELRGGRTAFLGPGDLPVAFLDTPFVPPPELVLRGLAGEEVRTLITPVWLYTWETGTGANQPEIRVVVTGNAASDPPKTYSLRWTRLIQDDGKILALVDPVIPLGVGAWTEGLLGEAHGFTGGNVYAMGLDFSRAEDAVDFDVFIHPVE